MSTQSKFDRFKDAPWFPKEDTHIIIGGAGGIGSWTALLLSRAGFKPIVYDFDILEEINMAGQLYPHKYINMPKVSALEKVVKEFCNEVILGVNHKMDITSPTHHYVISAFDNMLARKEMFKKWYDHMAENPHLRSIGLFIDGRLTAEQMWIFCIKGDDAEMCERYLKEHIFDDSEVEEAPCTMKQTSHAAAMIAAHITGFFTNHITNIVQGSEERTVPFCWEYFIPMDLINVT